MTQPARTYDDVHAQIGTAFHRSIQKHCPIGFVLVDTGVGYSGNANYGHRVFSSKPATVNTKPWTGTVPPLTSWNRKYQFVGIPCVQLYHNGDCYNVGGYEARWERWACANGLNLPLHAWELPSSSVVTAATQRFLNAVDEVDTDVELGVAFAERKQTAELFASTLGKIAGTIRRFKRTSPAGWKQILRDLAPPNWRATKVVNGKRYASLIQTQGSKIPEAWLEVQYGWRPVMQDVYNACKVVDDYQKRDLFIFQVDKTEKRKSPWTWAVSNNGTGIATVGDRWVRTDTTKVEIVRIACYGRINTSAWSTLDNVGLANPASILWETLPLSFILDWALPIGTWLNQWTATAGKQFLSGYRSEVLKSEGRSEFVNDNIIHGSIPFQKFTEGLNGFRYLHFNRTILNSWPAPRFPVLKNPASASHIASALSLIATAIYSDLPRYVRN